MYYFTSSLPLWQQAGLKYKLKITLPLVSGCIHDVAQLIFKGQPSKTLEKHAPI